jgi:hypothetical protein
MRGGALHILPRALVLSSRLDLTWVLLPEAVFESSVARQDAETGRNRRPKAQGSG